MRVELLDLADLGSVARCASRVAKVLLLLLRARRVVPRGRSSHRRAHLFLSKWRAVAKPRPVLPPVMKNVFSR